MSKFTMLVDDGPEGWVECPCGEKFAFDACFEENLILKVAEEPRRRYLVLKCPTCGLEDE